MLGAEAYELQPSEQAAGGLQTALMRTPPGLDRVIRYRSTSQLPHLDHTGRLLAVPGADGSVTVYDLSTGRQIRTFRSPSPRQFAVFSGDDRFVAAGGSDGTVTVWNLRTGLLSGLPLRVGGGAVRPVFDPRNDNRIYILSASGTLTVWNRGNPDHPRMVRAFGGVGLYGAYLSISPDGRLIAASELGLPDSGAAGQIFDTRTGSLLHTSGGPVGAFAADSVTLAYGFGGNTVVMNGRSGRIENTLRATGGTAPAAFSLDGHQIAVPEEVGGASAVAVYDLRTNRRVGPVLKLHANAAYPVGFLPDGRLVTTGPNEAAIWTPGRELPPLGVRLNTYADRSGGGAFPVEQPFFLPHSPTVIVNTIAYDPASGQPIGPLLGGAIEGWDAASPSGRLLIGYPSHRRGLGIWNLRTQRLLAVLPATPGTSIAVVGLPWWATRTVSPVRWSPTGRLIAGDVGGSEVYLWDVSDPRHPSLPRRIAAPGRGLVDDLEFTRDGRGLVVLWGDRTRLSMIDLAGGRAVWTRSLGSVGPRQYTVSPDGATIAYDSGDANAGQVTVLDAATGTPKATIAVPSAGGVGYLNSGRWLVITSDQPEPAAQLYDSATGQPFGVPFPTADIEQDPVVVDPAGTRFAETVAWDARRPTEFDPLLWTADPAAWLHTACAIAGRNLTHAEWHRYLPDRPYRRTCPDSPAD